MRQAEERAKQLFAGEFNTILYESNLETQAKQIRLDRQYLQDVDWKSQVVVLPDICVTQYSDERFQSLAFHMIIGLNIRE